jgi:ABC-type phosphate transport system substrate-binding protein
MQSLRRIVKGCAFLALLHGSLSWAGVVIVGHPALRKLDLQTVQRIYTGKVVEVDGVPVQPINAPPGQLLRQRFLSDYLQQNEGSYVAYWTVRRYVGKGAPPRELTPVAEVLSQVASTPGAIAYVDEADVTSAVSVLLRR